MRRSFVPPLAVLVAFALPSAPAAAAIDPYWPLLWGLHKVGAEAAWAVGAGAGVTIAVVDTGVDLDHEDLRDNVVPGRDFVAAGTEPRDRHGHGTHVAGTAAAVANNGIGVAGVAPRAKIMPVRVLNENGRGSLAAVEAGVRYAVDNGARVVNLSLGDHVIIENLTGGTLTDAVEYAWSKGAVAVVAAGNQQLFRTELRQAKALIVTATTPSDEKAPYATGVGLARWGIAAPGGTTQGGDENLILSTWWPKSGSARYRYAQGTSMAAPHVSGAVAILLGMGLTPQQAVDRLLSSARDIGPPGEDATFGHGLLDVAAAVSGLAPTGGAGVQGGGQGPEGFPGSASGSGGSAPAGGTARGPSTPEAQPGGSPGEGADPAEGEEEAPGEAAIAEEEPRAQRSPLPTLVTAAILVVALAGAVGYRRLRRLGGRSGAP